MTSTSERICRKCSSTYVDENGDSLGYCNSCRAENRRKLSASILTGILFILLFGTSTLCIGSLMNNIPSDSPLFLLGTLLWLSLGISILGPALLMILMFVFENSQKGSKKRFKNNRDPQVGRKGMREWWVTVPSVWAISMFYIMTNSLYRDGNGPSSPLFSIHALGVACLGIGLLIFRKHKIFTKVATFAVLINFVWLILEVQRVSK